MKHTFEPSYQNLHDAARNKEAKRFPLYEHLIANEIMEEITGKEMSALYPEDKLEYFTRYCEFYRTMGYDTVSFEGCITGILPGGGALSNSTNPPAISEMEDFQQYPWEKLPELYFEVYKKDFMALAQAMPKGMKAVGGVGNGVFECVQDLVGFENLCYVAIDDPELYALLFQKVGEVQLEIWKRFLAEFGDTYCVLRFGDDLGYKSNTMLSTDHIKEHIVPVYKNIVDVVHSYQKPFLLHSCGAIFDVMEDLITVAGIDAKHSNEDQIAYFPEWVERYGNWIGNFGGIDTDAVCRLSRSEMKEYIQDVVSKCIGHGGFAFGSGNSIPDYVPIDQYLMMNEIVRGLREE